LFQAKADAALVGINFQHHYIRFLSGRDDLVGVDVLLDPTHF